MIDFTKATVLPTSVLAINCTPHVIKFSHEGTEVVVEPCGATVSAKSIDTPTGKKGNAVLVKTVFESLPAGLEELETIERELPDAVIVGSIVSAQTYKGRVVAMRPAKGFERVPVAEKRMDCTNFTVFAEED